MKTALFELTHATETDIERIEQALRLHAGTIDLSNVPLRSIENRDLYVLIGYHSYSRVA
jgi:hypothetical protein